MFKIQTSAGGLLDNFLKDYQIWIDYKSFYDKPRHPIIVTGSGGFNSYHYRDVDCINNDPNPIIFIDLLTEGIHVRRFFEKYRTDKHYVLFSCGWWHIDLHTLPIRYDLVWYPWALAEMIDIYCSSHRFCFWLDKTYRFDPKPLKFISMIGNVRPERDKLVHALETNGLNVGSIIRYSGKDIGEPCNDDVVKINPGKFDPYTAVLSTYFHSISQTLPINIYNQGYFNLIVETRIDSRDEFLLSEKTIKCLITGMPFVIMSTPKFLHHLRALGFHTYDSLWSENYDDIDDTEKRIDAVVDLCKNLADFDWNHHQQSLKEIALKNRSRFLECNEIFNGVFEEFEQTIRRIGHGNQA